MDMVLGGLRRFSAITASLLLTGGLVWGCTHEPQIVLPPPGGTNGAVNTTPVNTAPVNTAPAVNTSPANTNSAPEYNAPSPQPSDTPIYSENVNQDLAGSNANTEVEPQGGNEAEEGEEVVVDVEAQARDSERVARVTEIQQALDAYKVANNAFPEVLDTLREGFLAEIPKDVDGDEFSYTPIGALPAQFYDLCYELEVGTASIAAGYHCASPEGIAHP